MQGVGNFATKLVAMATSLEELEKLVEIDNIHTNTFHLVKKSRENRENIFHCFFSPFLARSANLPTELYILLALISFFF